MNIHRDANGAPRIKGTTQDVAAVKQHLREDNIHGYLCTCGGTPYITITYAWGTPAISIKCPSCSDASVGFGASHIEATDKAIDSWNTKQERKALAITA